MTSLENLQKNTLIVSTLLLIGFAKPALAQNYYQMTWQQFYKLSAAQEPLSLDKPDYDLLDAAFFHATNEAREKQRRKPFAYAPTLHRSATGHSEAMIGRNFYDHINRTGSQTLDPHQRIRLAGGRYQATGENIAEYATIAIGQNYCPQRQRNGQYVYLDCRTKTPYEPYSYLAFARRVVDGWMNSPGHRRNILSEDFQYLGCATRLSRRPYQSQALPFARMTQNFGGRVNLQ